MAVRRLVLRRGSAGIDTRSAGTMSQFLREMFAKTDLGFTRGELRALLRAQPGFSAKIESSKRAHHNAVDNMLFRGDIEKREEKLYATRLLRTQQRGSP